MKARAAAAEDPVAASEYLILQLEERQLTLTEAVERFDSLQEIGESKRARIQTLILDLRIGKQLRATRDDKGEVIWPLYDRAGNEFLARLRSGPHPSAQVSRGYWYAMLEIAYASNNVEGMRLALESFEENLKRTAPGKTWVGPLLEKYRVQLQEIEDSAAKEQAEYRARAELAIAKMQLRPGQIVADIGAAGATIGAVVAEYVGEQGHVYAVNIHQASHESVRALGISNLTAVLSVPDDVSLPDASLDLAFLHDVASHVAKEARPGFYASIARALKPGAALLIFKHHGGGMDFVEELRGYGFVPEDLNALEEMTSDALTAYLHTGARFLPSAK